MEEIKSYIKKYRNLLSNKILFKDLTLAFSIIAIMLLILLTFEDIFYLSYLILSLLVSYLQFQGQILQAQ